MANKLAVNMLHLAWQRLPVWCINGVYGTGRREACAMLGNLV